MVTANQKFTKILRLKKESKQKGIVIRSQENRREREEKKTYKNNCKTITKMTIRTYLSKMILNINGFTLTKWIQKQDPFICCL